VERPNQEKVTMVETHRSLTLLTLFALAGSACVDPFHPDTAPVPPPVAQPGPSGSPTPTPPPGPTTPAPGPTGPTTPTVIADAAAPPAPAPFDAAPAPAPAPDAAVPDAPPPAPDVAADRAPKLDAPPPPEKIVNCPTPPGGNTNEELDCPVDPKVLDNWFPVTPPVQGCRPAPHPAVECLFYQFAWQHFLIATQPDPTGRPAFLDWNTIENTFGAGAGQPSPAIPFLSGGVTQAGGRQVLVDRKGHAIYYGIHMNKAFVDFVKENELTNAEAIKAADPNLAFPTTKDMVELKTAWMIVDDAAPPANFITTRAKVATLKVVNNRIEEDRTNLREVTVALIAIHVVYTLPGHPEFIWSSFQHIDANQVPDVAPSAAALPAQTRANVVPSMKDHLLYKGGTPVSAANAGVLLGPMFDPATQTFAAAQQSSIYRIFPGSKSTDPQIDDDVSAMTDNMIAMLKARAAQIPAYDKRPNYFIVGAIWQDRPEKTFKLNNVLTNPRNVGPDNPASITGGEDTMSSTAMESFTQGSDSFPNCFSCHDSRTATATGVPSARDSTAAVTLQPKLINVSHIFNEVVRENF
jgi:hypothetical protein